LHRVRGELLQADRLRVVRRHIPGHVQGPIAAGSDKTGTVSADHGQSHSGVRHSGLSRGIGLELPGPCEDGLFVP
jgi:hypothetical protein